MNTLLVIAIALILGLLSTRLMKLIGLPNVTGYLVVGLIIGPYALGGFIPGAKESFESLSIVSTVALGFIGFSIGVEFKLSHIKEIGKSAVVITFFQALAATLCVDVALILIGLIPAINMPVHEAIILGAIATATAPAATLMVVRQYKAKGKVTGTLLPVVALDDAVGLIVFAISNSIALSLAQSTLNAAAAVNATEMALEIAVWPIVEIVASLAIGVGIGALLSVIPRFFKSRDNRTISTIIAVALSLGICELFSYLKDECGCPFALSDLLVCMMAGATFVNMRKEATQIMEGTDRWTPVVLMLFFILSGAELDVRMFADWSVIVCLVVYLVMRCCGKYFGTMAGAAITKSDHNVRKYLGITLFPQAGVAIGMATMCKKEFEKLALSATTAEQAAYFSDIGAKIVTITMCAVMVYELVGPVLTKWALTKAGEISPENLRRPKRNKKALAAEGVVVTENVSVLDNSAEQSAQTTVETSVVDGESAVVEPSDGKKE